MASQFHPDAISLVQHHRRRGSAWKTMGRQGNLSRRVSLHPRAEIRTGTTSWTAPCPKLNSATRKRAVEVVHNSQTTRIQIHMRVQPCQRQTGGQHAAQGRSLCPACDHQRFRVDRNALTAAPSHTSQKTPPPLAHGPGSSQWQHQRRSAQRLVTPSTIRAASDIGAGQNHGQHMLPPQALAQEQTRFCAPMAKIRAQGQHQGRSETRKVYHHFGACHT